MKRKKALSAIALVLVLSIIPAATGKAEWDKEPSFDVAMTWHLCDLGSLFPNFLTPPTGYLVASKPGFAFSVEANLGILMLEVGTAIKFIPHIDAEGNPSFDYPGRLIEQTNHGIPFDAGMLMITDVDVFGTGRISASRLAHGWEVVLTENMVRKNLSLWLLGEPFLSTMTYPETTLSLVVVERGALSEDNPQQPATSVTPSASPQGFSVSPTSSTVLVNGDTTAFEAYNIGGSNFFKLRDLAFALNGTSKQFAVGWDGANNAVSLTSGEAYTPTGGEMEQGDGTAKSASPTTSSILLDGQELSLTAYNIGGNNFFRLRDLMSALDIGVTWDGAASTIGIDTSIPYAE